MFGNVGSMAAFRVGSDDAEFLSRQFAPVFTAQDLVNTENFNAYLKLLIQGYPSRPFNIRTFPDKKGDQQWGTQVMSLSLLKYGRPKETVEAEIYQKIRSVIETAKTAPPTAPAAAELK